jgi:predicted amidophosphoribosyltransferase
MLEQTVVERRSGAARRPRAVPASSPASEYTRLRGDEATRARGYEEVMLTPRAGFGVCRDCFNLTRGFDRCFACSHLEHALDAIAPISYSVAREPLNAALAGYKRHEGADAKRLAGDLALILDRFLADHEDCLAREAGIGGFDLVTTVPSSDRVRDETHPLRLLVGELSRVTSARHRRMLRRSSTRCIHRRFDRRRFEPMTSLSGERVLLVDDTWTTGANAQSAAVALKDAGASRVAVVVIGRHLNRYWHQNDLRLRKLARPFDWGQCALCIDGAGRSDRSTDSEHRAA